uniref:Uncharacterized protein n=1 Tax=Panagrolaimus davidi TaxID=227884 RepID=A0A914QYW2_9BILA
MEKLDKLFINKKAKSCLAFFEGNNTAFSLTVFDDKTDEVIIKFSIDSFNIIEEIIKSTVISKFKAVIFDVFNYESFAPLFQSNHEFCQAIKEKFTKAEIPTFFITSDDWLTTKALVFANYRSKRNDIVSMVKALGDGGIVVQDFKYTPDGYIKLTRHVFKTVKSLINDVFITKFVQLV